MSVMISCISVYLFASHDEWRAQCNVDGLPRKRRKGVYAIDVTFIP